MFSGSGALPQKRSNFGAIMRPRHIHDFINAASGEKINCALAAFLMRKRIVGLHQPVLIGKSPQKIADFFVLCSNVPALFALFIIL